MPQPSCCAANRRSLHQSHPRAASVAERVGFGRGQSCRPQSAGPACLSLVGAPYLFFPFPVVDGGRLNTIFAIPSSMARKYARCRVSAGQESSNAALSANL